MTHRLGGWYPKRCIKIHFRYMILLSRSLLKVKEMLKKSLEKDKGVEYNLQEALLTGNFQQKLKNQSPLMSSQHHQDEN